MKPFPLAMGALLCAAASPALAATFEIINADDPGEGLNDPTVVTPVGGNPGTTRGQQRLNVVQRAADHWAARVDSPVPIRIYVDFVDEACSTTSAVLVVGRPMQFLASGSSNGDRRWFPVAFVNARDGVDYTPANVAPEDADVWLRVNSLIDAGCDGNAGWHYGYDAATAAPADKHPLLPAVMEGVTRGLAFWLYNDPETGERQEYLGVGVNDALDYVLTDARIGAQGTAWSNLSTGDRWDSAHSFDQLVWGGAHVTAAAKDWLAPKAIGVVHGTLQRMEVVNGSLGPRLPLLATLNGRVVQGWDTESSSQGCAPLINAAALAGNIAIFDRGGCTFAQKGLAAQAAGAIAVLIANNDSYGASPMGGTEPALVIPVLGIGLEDSISLSGDDERISIGYATDEFAGTTRGRLRMGAATYETVARFTDISSFATSVIPAPLVSGGYFNRAVDDNLTVAMLRDLEWPLLPNLPNKAPYLQTAASFRAVVDQPSTLTELRFGDSDADGLALTLRFQVAAGSIVLAPDAAVQASGTGTGDASIEAPRGALMRYLMGGGVRFLSAPGNTSDVLLTVTIDDNGNTGSGGARSAVATATIEVEGAGANAPVATAQSLSTPRDTALSIQLTGTDADGDGVAFTVLTQPQHGTLGGVFGSVTYTPDAGYAGSDAFSFAALDGTLVSAPAQVSIQVTAPPQTVAVFADGFETP